METFTIKVGRNFKEREFEIRRTKVVNVYDAEIHCKAVTLPKECINYPTRTIRSMVINVLLKRGIKALHGVKALP